MCPGFESRQSHYFIYLFIYLFFDFFYLFIFFMFFLSLLLQCKFANSTLLSLLSFSYFITPYDAQASSAFSALILSLVTIFTVVYKRIRNVRNNMHIIKPIMKFCVLYGMTNPDAGGIRAGGIRTQSARRFRCP